MKRRSYLMKLEKEVKQRQEEERKRRMALTEEYTSLIFSIGGSPVEDVEKVCDIVKSFISSGQISADRDLRIPLNKKLRNAEVKQFVYNIIRYNKKENLDVESFLLTTFGEGEHCQELFSTTQRLLGIERRHRSRLAKSSQMY